MHLARKLAPDVWEAIQKRRFKIRDCYWHPFKRDNFQFSDPIDHVDLKYIDLDFYVEPLNNKDRLLFRMMMSQEDPPISTPLNTRVIKLKGLKHIELEEMHYRIHENEVLCISTRMYLWRWNQPKRSIIYEDIEIKQEASNHSQYCGIVNNGSCSS